MRHHQSRKCDVIIKQLLKWNMLNVISCSRLRLPCLFELCVLCDFLQIEDIVTLIQDETEGVPIRTVKSFMTKIPSVVTGKTLSPLCVQALWLMMVEMLFR